MSRRLRIELVDDPGRLPRAWDACVEHAGPLLQRRGLGALVGAPLAGAHIVCGLAWLDGELVAAGVFHLVPFEPSRTGRFVADGHWLTRVFLALTGVPGGRPHLLLCGHWLHADARGFTCDGSRVEPGATLHAMLGKVRRHCARRVALEVVKGPDLPAEGAALEVHGYHRVDTAQPTMRMSIDPAWRGWDGYVGAMRKKYRQRARAARARGASLQREELGAQQIREHAARLDALLDSVLQRADVVLTPPRAATLAALKRSLGKGLTVVAYRHAGRLVGFVAFAVRHDALEGLLIGLEPQANRTLRIYQNILYDLVERAMSAAVPVLELGRTALEIKSAAGAEPVAYPVWVRNENRFLNWILGLSVRRIRPPEWEPRHVFGIRTRDDSVQVRAG